MITADAAAQTSWDRYQVGAAHTARPIILDGVLDEEAWAAAGLIDALVQQEPNEGAPASERTEIRVLYDAENLYFGVRVYDSDPSGVWATEMRRDSDRILDEDNIQIILDTFKDSRSAYMFATNPLGARLDQQVFNEGEGVSAGGFGVSTNINKDWDGVWHVQTSRLDDGWIAEIAIPIVTLRFPAGDVQSWGLNVKRNIGRKNEQAFWAPIPKAYDLTRVSLAGSLSGMQSLSRGLDLRVTPFATSGASRVLETGIEDDNFQREVGLDLKYGITAGLNLDLTVNTDFAQAEVDDEQVNLTRFALFFPEKRDFFLENSGQFNMGSVNATNRLADLFFSRRIGLSATGEDVPILGGARMTGKIGRNDIAVMNVRTDRAFGSSGENYFVSRYSRNLFARSRVGAMFINKDEVGGPHYNRTFAADMSLAPLPTLSIVGFLAKTESPGFSDNQMGSYINASWLDARWKIFSEFADLEDNFNPEVGFLPRRGVRTSKHHFEWDPRPDRWGIRQFSPMVNYIYTTDQNNRKLSTRTHVMNRTIFQTGADLTVWYNHYFERLDAVYSRFPVDIAAGDYTFGEWRFQFRSNPARRLYYELVYSPQDFYDGTRSNKEVKLGARLTDRVSAEGAYARNDVDLRLGSFDVDLASLRVDFALSPTMTLRSIGQYNSQEDEFGLAARFRWTYSPGSDLYVTYDEQHYDPFDPTGILEIRERRLTVKATFLITR